MADSEKSTGVTYAAVITEVYLGVAMAKAKGVIAGSPRDIKIINVGS